MRKKILLSFLLAFSTTFPIQRRVLVSELVTIPLDYYLEKNEIIKKNHILQETILYKYNFEYVIWEKEVKKVVIIKEEKEKAKERVQTRIQTLSETENRNFIKKSNICEHRLFYSYMDISEITDTTSAQWELSRSAYVSDYGIMSVDGYYLVAMGSKYAKYIGQKFLITFEDGTQTKVMIGDFKQDRHTTNEEGCTGADNGDLIEVIMSTNNTPNDILVAGSFHITPLFPSYVSLIEEIF